MEGKRHPGGGFRKNMKTEDPTRIHWDVKRDIKRFLVVSLMAVLMSVNIKTFVRTGGLFPGGATGLTLLIQRSVLIFLNIHLPFSLVNILLNSIPVYIGFRFIGKKFTLLSCWMIVLSGIVTDMIPGYVITQDILLISIFGGIINGFVISMCLLMNATTGGTDFISIFLSERKGMDSFNMILMMNAVILVLAGLLFGWDKALYSIIFQYASTMVIHMLYRKYQQVTLFVVTDRPREVCDEISQISHHGATILEGMGSYLHKRRNIVYSVVSGAEAGQVVRAVKKLDEKAFINQINTKQLQGRFYYRRED